MFEKLIGNEQIKSYLKRVAEKGTVGNSLLFSGPEGIGKTLFAEAFAALLQQDPKQPAKINVGTHPDIHLYRPEGKTGMHSIASMRQFSEEVFLSPHEGKWKIFIIQDAERMLPSSANALLKTFEEPAKDALIILISSNPQALLPTIISRCRQLRFQRLSEQDIAACLMQTYHKQKEEALLIAALAQGSLGKALKLMQRGENPARPHLIALLFQGETHYKKLSEAAAAIAETSEEGKKALESALKAEYPKDLTAAQKEGLEKEIEGALAMHGIQEAKMLFESVLYWYRDIALHHINGNRALLMHRDHAEASFQAFQSGAYLPLEKVLKAIREACLALERSTSLQICLENLFLKLNIIRPLA